MKIKRITSVCLIFLVLLTSLGYSEGCSQNDFTSGKSYQSSSTQLIEYTQDLSQEFLESYKISLLEETKSDMGFLAHKPAASVESIPGLRYVSYLRAHFSKPPTKRLFIDFGALII